MYLLDMASAWDAFLFVVFFPVIVVAAAASIPVTVFCGIPIAFLWAALVD
jgi:hypothetical protein